MKYLFLVTTTALAFSMAGCQSIRDDCDDFMIGMSHKVSAHKAWCDTKHCYDVDHKCHFKKGFVAGYRDVAAGGNGCPPEIPPRCYWQACYQNLEGQEKTAAWFDGFSHGAMIAERDGINQFSHIYISPHARAGMMQEDQVIEVPYDDNGMGDGDPEPLPLIPPAPGTDPKKKPGDPVVPPPYIKPNPKDGK